MNHRCAWSMEYTPAAGRMGLSAAPHHPPPVSASDRAQELGWDTRVTSPLLSSAESPLLSMTSPLGHGDPQGHIPTAQQCRGAWQLLSGRSMVRGNCKAVAIYSCCKDIPRASASHNANQSGSLPSDSCPRTNTAGTWLCSKGSHVSPLRGSLIHSKRYSSLDLRSNIYLSSLTPRLLAHSLCSDQEPQQFGLTTPEQQRSHKGQKGSWMEWCTSDIQSPQIPFKVSQQERKGKNRRRKNKI